MLDIVIPLSSGTLSQQVWLNNEVSHLGMADTHEHPQLAQYQDNARRLSASKAIQMHVWEIHEQYLQKNYIFVSMIYDCKSSHLRT